jgi:hypothetical protein
VSDREWNDIKRAYRITKLIKWIAWIGIVIFTYLGIVDLLTAQWGLGVFDVVVVSVLYAFARWDIPLFKFEQKAEGKK